MCGRYGFSVKDEREFLDRFDIETIDFELNANWNVAPTHEMPVIERHSPNSLHIRKWGVPASWAKMLMINAKAETLDTAKTWKKPFQESRIIVPAIYFFEWKKISEKEKQPYLIRLKSKEMFGFAGLLLNYKNEKGEHEQGYVIITTRPNDLMEGIHNRMPVILSKEDEDQWLNLDSDIEELKKMFDPFPSSQMESYPVSSLVNKPANNFPEITKQI